MRNPIEMVAAVAQLHPEITLGEYFKHYEPSRPTNDICTKCRRCGTSTCEWDKNFAAVPGWVADVETEEDKPGTIKSALIYYCPRFESEADNGPLMPFDEEKSFDLLLAIAEQAGEGYRALLKKIDNMRHDLKATDGTSPRWPVYATEYYNLLTDKRMYEDLLPAHFKSMQMKLGFEEDKEFDDKTRRFVARRGKGKTYETE